MSETTEFVVVGAGFAGLCAARELRKAGRDVIVLEARDRVGGRAHSVTLDDGTVLEMGGQWTGNTQERILALAKETGVGLFPQNVTGQNLIALGGKLKRYTGNIPKVGAGPLLSFGVALARLDRMAKTVPLEAPWRAPKAERWDAMTVETWARRNVPTRTGRDLFRLAVRAVFACEPADLSLLHLLFYVHSGGGWDIILEFKDGAQEHLFVEGSQAIAERVAAELGDAVRLEQPVRSIRHDDAGVVVRSDGLEVSARRVIVAIPPTLTARIVYDPPLSGFRDQLTQRMPQGSVTKCFAVYETPFWRRAGFSGHATALSGEVQLVYDAGPPDGQRGVIMALLEGHGARTLNRRGPAARKQAVLDAIARYFGPEGRAPIHYVDKNWADEEWTRGCYTGFFGPGAWTSLGEHLRAPCGRIHWAGTETAEVWNGYFDGAVRSGERAAREALALEPQAAKAP